MSAPSHLPSLESRFVNEVRLTGPQWLIALSTFLLIVVLTPGLWKRMETFRTDPGYRIPYSLSRDYWLYERRLSRVEPGQIPLLGDSVIWGEYVRPDGTLSHFLNRSEGASNRFVNAGVNGMFPLALEGLVRSYGAPLHHRKVILQANLLWMTSPKADLSTPKEERFNHSDLVPQFTGRPPCYRADFNQRLTAAIEREIPFLGWVNHLQVVYFGQKSLTQWTLEEGPADATQHPNAFRNPWAQITLEVPGEPATDPERGVSSPRHKPWSTTGVGSTRFEWVELNQSLQWAALQRLIELLRSRGNDVLVILGPFNEHIMDPENQATFRRLRDGVQSWLATQGIPHLVPSPLPSALYADASHPLTAGYELLADKLNQDPLFQAWLKKL